MNGMDVLLLLIGATFVLVVGVCLGAIFSEGQE